MVSSSALHLPSQNIDRAISTLFLKEQECDLMSRSFLSDLWTSWLGRLRIRQHRKLDPRCQEHQKHPYLRNPRAGRKLQRDEAEDSGVAAAAW
eukprot:symbB.v1.2.031445.t1/scaffold3649.1/size52700/1